MTYEKDLEFFEDEECESGEMNSVWDMLTPQQKKYFKKLSEKNPENLIYIG